MRWQSENTNQNKSKIITRESVVQGFALEMSQSLPKKTLTARQLATEETFQVLWADQAVNPYAIKKDQIWERFSNIICTKYLSAILLNNMQLLLSVLNNKQVKTLIPDEMSVPSAFVEQIYSDVVFSTSKGLEGRILLS